MTSSRKEILSGDREEIMCHIAALRGHEEECSGYYCDKCEANSIYWLCAEYEPPLLKNGDGLKPGDWIMVRTEGLCGWKKRKFMCYAEGDFSFLITERVLKSALRIRDGNKPDCLRRTSDGRDDY